MKKYLQGYTWNDWIFFLVYVLADYVQIEYIRLANSLLYQIQVHSEFVSGNSLLLIYLTSDNEFDAVLMYVGDQSCVQHL